MHIIILLWILSYSFLSCSFFLLIQFSMLAERLTLERQEIQVRKKAQEKVCYMMLLSNTQNMLSLQAGNIQ